MALVALTEPLSCSQSSFKFGQQSTFNVYGTGFNSANISAVSLSSTTTGISWTLGSFSVTDSTTLSVTGTPSSGTNNPLMGDVLGDLTVTINPNSSSNRSTASNNYTYKTR